MKNQSLRKILTKSAGASLVEYSLLVALVASTSLASTQMLGYQIGRQFQQVFKGGGTSYGGDHDPSTSTGPGSKNPSPPSGFGDIN